MSTIIDDLRKLYETITNERWICKKCARTVYNLPSGILVCNCGSIEWHYTTVPPPVA